jgi:nucleoside-diphosphate-sugar epimerase
MKRILVTGATGFVGKEIVSALVNGYDIYTCARSPHPEQSKQSDLPNYLSVDIAAAESVNSLREKLPELDCVVHSAGLAHQFQAPKDPRVFTRVNVEGTRKIAQLAAEKGSKKIILISSISVYGEGKPNPTDEDFPCRPAGAYAVSKYEAEIAAREVCEKNNIDLTILRLATVYGERDVGNVLRLIKLLDSGKFFWTGKGDNSKSLLYVKDAARACRLAIEKDRAGSDVFNVTDRPHTMREIVETIAAQMGKKILGFSVPPSLVGTTLKTLGNLPVVGKRARGLADSLKKWQSDDVLSGEKIKARIGFETETSLAKGIKKEVEWYLSSK